MLDGKEMLEGLFDKPDIFVGPKNPYEIVEQRRLGHSLFVNKPVEGMVIYPVFGGCLASNCVEFQTRQIVNYIF